MLSFLFISSNVAECHKNSNEQIIGSGSGGLTQAVEPNDLKLIKICSGQKGAIDPLCGDLRYVDQMSCEVKSEVESKIKTLGAATNDLQDIISTALKHFHDFDKLHAEIKSNKLLSTEIYLKLLTKLDILKYKLHVVMGRIAICNTKIVLQPMLSRKPDFEHIFLNDFRKRIEFDLYNEVINVPFENRQHKGMATLLDKIAKLLKKMPVLCDKKWDLERDIEELQGYTFSYVPEITNLEDLSWLKFLDDDDGYDGVVETEQPLENSDSDVDGELEMLHASDEALE